MPKKTSDSNAPSTSSTSHGEGTRVENGGVANGSKGAQDVSRGAPSTSATEVAPQMTANEKKTYGP
ncbi:hypothetical protein HBI23_256770 [Parastagonospora nodorum]|nr:hypothetical protein HBI23_256770 [Parastagonospora nodorum]KAH6132821.1 hypothetical protein HBI68_254990 [Parastagonospora nodorum]KAH6380439.1 hypothetical protein HBI08_239930 [Parastagonospora nodorum]KAH6383062.1 hypothetical protein HBI60_258910 [Parastagonospora nodorum]